MFVQNLKSLSLRGVSVLTDGVTIGTRLGFGYLAVQPPAVPVTLRQGDATALPMAEPDVDNPPAQENPRGIRAGRSVRFAGVSVCRSATHSVAGCSLTGHTRGRGKSSSSAATSATFRSPGLAAGDKTGPLVRAYRPAQVAWHRQGQSWAKPAGRTPPASTAGRDS
jgi:hypothetical protein